MQAARVEKLEVDETWITVPPQVGEVKVRIVRPVAAADVLPVILYIHGGSSATPVPTTGWCAISPSV